MLCSANLKKSSAMSGKLMGLLVVITLLQGCTAAVMGVAALSTGGAAMAILSDRRADGVSEKDDKIAELIIKRLEQDQLVSSSAHIKAFSFNRVVLLAGEAPNQATRRQAVEIARRVPGIRKVHNEIVLASPLSKAKQEYDMQLRINGNTALVTATNVSASHVHLTTSDRVVYVMGLLTRDEARHAIDVIRRVEGVKKVVSLVEYVRLVSQR